MTSTNVIKAGIALISGVFASSLVLQAVAQSPELIKNPYENVNWDQVQTFKANFHSHTVRSDGRAEPDELIYMYADAGYHILSINDHDNYFTHREGERDVNAYVIHRDEHDAVPTSESSWPWTRWIEEQPSKIWVYRGMESSAYYPFLGERGMLAVRGAELTTHPHISSLFNNCGWPHRDQSDDERMACVEENGGLLYWVHPTHYVPGAPWEDRFLPDHSWEEMVDYFGGYITKYDSNLGFEMRVHGERLERDLELLDRLLERFYRDHDIFIKGSDDNHATSVADDATMTLVLATDLTEEAVRYALENGHTFVGSRTGSYPRFNGIEVNEQTHTILLDIANFERITWFRDGEEYTSGTSASFDYSQIGDAILRFEVEQDGATFYSQGFYIR